MKTIWKFTVPVTDSQQIKIDGATLVEILDAKRAAGEPGYIDIWAVVDAHPGSAEYVPIEIRGTGHPLHEERLSHYNAKYPEDPCAKNSHIATVIDGPFVWHVFRGGVFE
ncbi:hypothetical protein KNU02_gp79 [Gordonia phage Pleakley]|uniref:DUF7352 domain-containing protein n=1 Tax=Gordonia phage Pleakley TaxID=2283246 RepID=A0A345M6J7_9CAUD|nr:hypothetical protein KNU02_gp79 [Gordonia phage Pleakley]AXH49804.1 hypothetical protein SEA_FURY_79 [Gordonia phage Fury]AXH66118.1 hypothetical protein SEA_PLEAKLEY_79 [Gordonia phage Pleakley]